MIRANLEECKVPASAKITEETEDDDEATLIKQLSDEKRQRMREMAKKLSINISEKAAKRKQRHEEEMSGTVSQKLFSKKLNVFKIYTIFQ